MFEELLEVPLLRHYLPNVPLSQFDFVILYNEHGTLDTATIGVDLDFFLINISHDGVLFGNPVCSPHFSYFLEQFSWIVVVSNPLSIEEYLVGSRVLIIRITTKWLYSDIS